MIESALSGALVALALPPAIAAQRMAGYDATVWRAELADGRPVAVRILRPGASSGGDPIALGHLLGTAQAHLHAPLAEDGSVLCHLDFQPFNVLAAGDRVTGIVDWANACVGDRREDLAWTRVVLAFGSALVPQFAAGIDDFTTAWRAGYAQLRTMPGDDELTPFLADAAERQLSNWQPRAAAGECSAAVLERAVALTRRWPQ